MHLWIATGVFVELFGREALGVDETTEPHVGRIGPLVTGVRRGS